MSYQHSKFWQWLTGAAAPPAPQTGQTTKLRLPFANVPLLLNSEDAAMLTYLKSREWEWVHLGRGLFMVKRPDQDGVHEMYLQDLFATARQMYADDAREWLMRRREG